MVMKARQNIQLVHPGGLTRKQWRQQFLLLIGGASLLLAWLSVGLVPSTWWLLLQALRQFDTLWAQQGTSVLGLLLLLAVQSLFLLSAWALLIWVAVREGIRLRAMGSETEEQISAQPAIADVASVSALYQPTMASIVPSPAIQEPPLLLPPDPTTAQSSHPERPALPRVQVTLTPAQSDTYEVGSPARSSLAEQRTVTPSLPVQETRITASEKIVQAPRIAYKAEVPLQRHASLSPDGPEFLFQEKQTSSSMRQRTQQKRGHGEDLRDPFTVHEDVVKMFLQENPLVKAREQAEQKQLAGEEKQEFVFGNPFEGLLPDVFEHDEDLKRSIKEQHAKVYPRSISSNEPPMGGVSKPSIFEHPQ